METRDQRLKNLSPGQYRLWRDSYTNMIPRTQSITKPDRPENIQINITVSGEIQHSAFKPPVVEFRNTLKTTDLFDRYSIATIRNTSEGIRDENWRADALIRAIRAKLNVHINIAIGAVYNKNTYIDDTIVFNHISDEYYKSNLLTIIEPAEKRQNYITAQFHLSVEPITTPNTFKGDTHNGYTLYIELIEVSAGFDGGLLPFTGNKDQLKYAQGGWELKELIG